MILFENNIVKSEMHPELNGLRVKRTVRWCYTGDMNGTTYEVVLSDDKTYQLDESELIVPVVGGGK